MPAIVLAAINARYRHCSLALRCLYANLGTMQGEACVREYTLAQPAAQILEDLLRLRPRILALSCAIWNTTLLGQVMALCRQVAPEIILVVGGPEITAREQPARIRALADHLICGEGETAFADCCRTLLAGAAWPRLFHATPPDLDALALPYDLYSEEDIRHRIIVLEATRGCPFRCAFCASARDQRLRQWPRNRLFAAWNSLIERGARSFKFLDRSFNATPELCDALLAWFLDHYQPGLHLHAEFVPDRLADSTKALLQRCPADAVQLEIGLQSCTPAVLTAIDRQTDLERCADNLRWLGEHSRAHLHVDLIVGLPGETPQSMAESFDRLWGWLAPARSSARHHPHHIQVGILKRLPGTPLAERDQAGRYDPDPPYALLANPDFDFRSLQGWKRFARYADLFLNTPRFRHRIALLFEKTPTPAAAFLAFSDWLWATMAQEHGISLSRQESALAAYLTQLGHPEATIDEAGRADRQAMRRASARPALACDRRLN